MSSVDNCATDRPTLVEVVRSIVFYLAFYGGSLLIVPAAALAQWLGHERLLRRAAAVWSGWHRLCARYLLDIRVSVEGNVPRNGVLFAIRHESFFEAIDLPTQYELPVPFAKSELMRIPLWGAAGARYGLIGVDRAAGAKTLRTMISAAREKIADGRPLVIFPEGTRVPHGQSPELQSGFAGLYKLLGLPVVPVAVDSGPLYHRRWKRAGTIHYRYGEPIPPGLAREDVEARVRAAITVLNAA